MARKGASSGKGFPSWIFPAIHFVLSLTERYKCRQPGCSGTLEYVKKVLTRPETMRGTGDGRQRSPVPVLISCQHKKWFSLDWQLAECVRIPPPQFVTVQRRLSLFTVVEHVV